MDTGEEQFRTRPTGPGTGADRARPDDRNRNRNRRNDAEILSNNCIVYKNADNYPVYYLTAVVSTATVPVHSASIPRAPT
jgi:hypothetical protein